MSNNTPEKKCEPCGECEGSGLWAGEDENNKIFYIPCEFCGGYQCLTKGKFGWGTYS